MKLSFPLLPSFNHNPKGKTTAISLVFAILFVTTTTNAITTTKDNDAIITYNIQDQLNHRAFGIRDEDGADFDGQGHYFLQKNTSSTMSIDAISFKSFIGDSKDNMVAKGQTLALDDDADNNNNNTALGALYLLTSASFGPTTPSKVRVLYKDNTHSDVRISVPDWQAQHLHQLRYLKQRFPISASDTRDGALYALPVFVDPRKSVRSITLPADDHLHVFAMTGYRSSSSSSSNLKVFAARSAGWASNNQAIVEVLVHNISPKYQGPVDISINDHEKSATLKQLAPGHMTTVRGVITTTTSSKMDVTIALGDCCQETFTLDFGSPSQVNQHQAPEWLQNAKFGIFIHWGLYSVPAWAPVGKEYSEWYWWQMNHENDPTYAYHNKTYGADFAYDDFINSTQLASHLDPRAWLDLVDAAHARYFVFTTKHHDGFALWDTKVTDRSFVKMGPKRDIVKDLMTTAASSYPHLKRGLYFSLPEWYHPQYKDDSLGWHGPPMNPYTQKEIPYTGYRKIDDFVHELQVPQAKELLQQHQPDIFWCDIGGIHDSLEWQKEYFSAAASRGQQVAVNDRCGDGSASDFTTVEYKTVDTAPDRFWEATRGIDPYSFGYNQATPKDKYATTEELIKELITTVARGGNFLLNMGPDASGKVLEPMNTRLREMGEWLDRYEAQEAIFNTTTFWAAPDGVDDMDDGHRLYFTVADTAFYIFTLEKPSTTTLVIDAPIPIHPTLGKVSCAGQQISWSLDDQGRLVLEISDHVINASQYAWIFKVTNPN